MCKKPVALSSIVFTAVVAFSAESIAHQTPPIGGGQNSPQLFLQAWTSPAAAIAQGDASSPVGEAQPLFGTSPAPVPSAPTSPPLPAPPSTPAPAYPAYPAPPTGQGQPPAEPAPASDPPGYQPYGYGSYGYATTPYGYPPPPPPPPPPLENLHDGFFLRMHLGFGYTRVKGSGATAGMFAGDVEYSGGSTSLGIALGGTVAPNLAVYGAFLASIATDGNASSAGVVNEKVVNSAGLFGLGGGVAYYLQPANVYLSGTVAGVQFDLSDTNNETIYESELGLGFQGLIGKEWWVSSNWGLGIAGELIAASMKDAKDSNLRWRGTALSLLFSATYN